MRTIQREHRCLWVRPPALDSVGRGRRDDWC